MAKRATLETAMTYDEYLTIEEHTVGHGADDARRSLGLTGAYRM